MNKYVFNWSREAAENKCHNWWWHVKKLLCDLDLVHLLDDHANGMDIIPTIDLALQNKVETNWLAQLNREQAKLGLGRNKLRSYREFKSSFCCETCVEVSRECLSQIQHRSCPYFVGAWKAHWSATRGANMPYL